MRYTSRRPCEGPHPIMKSPSLSSLGNVANDTLTTCKALSEDTGAMPHGSHVATSSRIQGPPANIRKQGPNLDSVFCSHPRTNALSISGQNFPFWLKPPLGSSLHGAWPDSLLGGEPIEPCHVLCDRDHIPVFSMLFSC